MARVRRAVALTGAVMIALRLWPTLPANAAQPPLAEGAVPEASCPFCDAEKNPPAPTTPTP
jgi:hypothetical protein